VNRENLESSPVEVIMTATITSNNETGFKDFSVMISPVSSEMFTVMPITISEWEHAQNYDYGMGYIDSYISVMLDENRALSKYPTYGDVKVSLSIKGQQEVMKVDIWAAYDGIRSGGAQNALQYFGLTGDQDATVEINYLDTDGQVLGTELIDFVLVDLREEIQQAFEDEKNELNSTQLAII
jgi:hypothetical protein